MNETAAAADEEAEGKVDDDEEEESEIVDALKNGNNVVAFFCKYLITNDKFN